MWEDIADFNISQLGSFSVDLGFSFMTAEFCYYGLVALFPLKFMNDLNVIFLDIDVNLFGDADNNILCVSVQTFWYAVKLQGIFTCVLLKRI